MHGTSPATQFIILPPAQTNAPRVFKNIEVDNLRYDDLLAQMQRLRGVSYLRDGAIQEDELTPDGRHKLSIDEHSWHVLTVDEDRRVSGCMRYLEEKKAAHFDDLWIHQSALAHCPVWGRRFRRAVEAEMALARKKRVGFGEVGGWAVAESRRWTADPLRMVLATCALLRVVGGSTGLATATVRHGSASILRRIGLRPLRVDGMEVPSYYDSCYGCHMEALRFDSDSPNPKYAQAISDLSSQLEQVPVVCRESKVAEWRSLWRGLELPAAHRPMPTVLAPN